MTEIRYKVTAAVTRYRCTRRAEGGDLGEAIERLMFAGDIYRVDEFEDVHVGPVEMFITSASGGPEVAGRVNGDTRLVGIVETPERAERLIAMILDRSKGGRVEAIFTSEESLEDAEGGVPMTGYDLATILDHD